MSRADAPRAAGLPNRAWAAWQRLARRVAEFQGRVLLAVLYALLIIPVGLLLRLLADPLGRRGSRTTNWTRRVAPSPTLEDSRRQ